MLASLFSLGLRVIVIVLILLYFKFKKKSPTANAIRSGSIIVLCLVISTISAIQGDIFGLFVNLGIAFFETFAFIGYLEDRINETN